MTVYAVYKGDRFIDVGSVEEICDRIGWKKATVVNYSSPSNQKRVKRKERSYIIIKWKEKSNR